MIAADHLRDERWNAVLDDLEASIWTGEQLELPDDLGPLPAHLVARASLILEQQLAAMDELGIARAEVAAELESIARLRPSRSVTAPQRNATFTTSL
jgi:hypothetical protein